jgi:very-short-patch-repair endonuclease
MAHGDQKVSLARAFRLRMTPSEAKLWRYLRAGRFHGLSFSRQEPVGPFILDFYCSVCRLAIELDGLAHNLTVEADRTRQEWLEGQGIRVLRFSNSSVMSSLPWVLNQIYLTCEGHIG